MAMLFTLTLSPAGLANPVVEDYQSPLFQDLHLPTYIWMQANTSPKAIIVALHGGCLHGRSFRTLGRAMSERQYMLVSLDMRGYGAWYCEDFGSQEDRHFNYAISEQDIIAVIAKLREYFPGKPIFVLGESLGANMSEKLMADVPEMLDGGVLVNPYVKPHLFFHPYMPLTFLRGLTNPFAGANLVPYLKSRLSEDQKQALEQINDPLSRDKQSMTELFQSLFFNMRARKSVSQIPADKPILFLVGKRDRLCNPKATEKQYKNMLNNNKTMVLLKERGHLLVETTQIQPEILDILDLWLQAQIE